MSNRFFVNIFFNNEVYKDNMYNNLQKKLYILKQI